MPGIFSSDRESMTRHCFDEMMFAIRKGDDYSAKWWGMWLYRYNRPTWWIQAYN